MSRKTISEEYFEWMFDVVCGERFHKDISYRKLLTYLHEREFTYIIPRDANRAEDGIYLRYRFAYDLLDDPRRELGGPCTVFEMMVALAIRCEETIMDDPDKGDRTGQWFWGMIVNLGLGAMTDDVFDIRVVESIIDRFLSRNYEPNGKGGLFTIRNYDTDLREMEIWNQLCRYLDGMI